MLQLLVLIRTLHYYLFQERRKEAERMAREREELRRQQEQLRYEQEKRNNLKRGREVEHGCVRFECLHLSRVMASLCL